MLTEQLLPKDIREKIPPMYTNENNPSPDAVVRLFNPHLNWTWYIIEGEEIEEDYIFLGYAKTQEEGYGYFTLSDVTKCIGVERDLNYKPQPIKEIINIK